MSIIQALVPKLPQLTTALCLRVGAFTIIVVDTSDIMQIISKPCTFIKVAAGLQISNKLQDRIQIKKTTVESQSCSVIVGGGGTVLKRSVVTVTNNSPFQDFPRPADDDNNNID